MHSSAITENSCFKRLAITYGGLLENAAQMRLDMLSAMHFIAQDSRLLTPTTIKSCFAKYGCLIDHVTSNDNSTVKVTEDEEDERLSM
jgi:hypothetical protein